MENNGDQFAAAPDAGKECNVYVGNLSWETNSELLASFLSGTAQPVSVTIAETKSGRSLGYAIAVMASPSDAQAVIFNCNDLELDSRRIIARADVKPKKPSRAAKGGGGGGGGGGGFQQQNGEVTGCRVYVGNLIWEADVGELSQLLSAHANPLEVNIQMSPAGRSRGYALAVFSSVQEASAVISGCNGLDFAGRQLQCREDRGTR